MIEAVAKAAEGLEKAKETKSNFDPDKKLEKKSLNTENQQEGYDPDKKVAKETDNSQQDVKETKEKRGGSYKDLKDAGFGENSEPPQEVHHMPADSASDLPRDDGPAITMDKEDHRETASCGNSKEAQEYRAKQKELIEQGKFREALQMDIDDIHEKFGDKYDDAIKDMLDYVDKLEEEGRV